MAKIKRREGVSFAGLALNARGAERAIEAGVDEVRYVVVSSETFNQRNQGATIDESLAGFSEIADKVIVMYAGQVIEAGTAIDIFTNPKMPYTAGLMNSIPEIKNKNDSKQNRLKAIPGNVPNPLYLPSGCRFHPRCEFSKNTCKSKMPNLENISNEHYVRCSLWENINLQMNYE